VGVLCPPTAEPHYPRVSLQSIATQTQSRLPASAGTGAACVASTAASTLVN
jgi:hypothetical protein